MLARGAESTVRRAPEKDPLHGEPSEHDLVMPGDLISSSDSMVAALRRQSQRVVESAAKWPT